MSNNDDKDAGLLLDHDYDGIRELDHPLPRWWLNLFYVSIVFAVLYAGYYMLGFGPTLTQELNVKMNAINEAQARAPKPSSGSDEALMAAMEKAENREFGSAIYAGKCAACHGDKGQGLIGPNLTDRYWIHGGKPSQIAKVVNEGVLDKGMPPWGTILKPDEVVQVVVYIASLKDTNPPGAKEPQGEVQ